MTLVEFDTKNGAEDCILTLAREAQCAANHEHGAIGELSLDVEASVLFGLAAVDSCRSGNVRHARSWR
jgi:hypothetical protein